MKEAYVDSYRFQAKSLKLIKLCDEIVSSYDAQGFRLTVRQLYYQLVARGHIENTVRSYDNIVQLMTNARLAGLIDWDAIEDRTRDFIDRAKWNSGGEILSSCASQYHEDLWQNQETRVFVVVEKEALAGVLERTCRAFDVPLLPARGYPSATTLREFAKLRIMGASQRIVLLHLGDHDPSGIDMTRDLEERLTLFSRQEVEIEFKRIALNMDQIEEQKPPANPAKVTDSRFEAYAQRFGDESWELDALSPQYLHQLVSRHIEEHIDADALRDVQYRIARIRARLKLLADNFDDDQEG